MTEPTTASDPTGVPSTREPRRGTRRFSLRRRVMLLATLCVGGTLALVSVGAYFTVRSNMYQQFDDSLVERAAAAVRSPVVQSRVQAIPGAFLVSSDIRIGLLTAEGELVHPRAGSAPPWGEEELAVSTGVESSSLRTDEDTGMRVVAMRSGSGEAMVLAQSLAPVQGTLADLSLVLFLFGGAGILVAAVAGTAVARAGLRPVQNLTSATERVAHTMDLRSIPVSGDDELARLTHSFNTMLGAVADSQERQRRLVADAGHELRTPLTSLRTNLELLLSAERNGASSLSRQDRTEIERDIRDQLEELTQLIGDLVELAREEPPPEQAERVNLADIVNRALERVRPRTSDVEFEVSLSPWLLTGETEALERAVLNLLDNAVKFAPSRSVVQVSLRPLGDGTAVLEIADSGPGIAEEDIPRLFDRFYRAAGSRSLPGSGLGLAIVKQAVQRHGGTVYVGHSASGGALLSVRLPGDPEDRQ